MISYIYHVYVHLFLKRTIIVNKHYYKSLEIDIIFKCIPKIHVFFDNSRLFGSAIIYFKNNHVLCSISCTKILFVFPASYTGDIFKKGYKYSDLEEPDLYEVIKDCGSKGCGDKIEKQWTVENKKETPPSVTRLLWAGFGVRYMIMGLINMAWKVFTR